MNMLIKASCSLLMTNWSLKRVLLVTCENKYYNVTLSIVNEWINSQ